MRTPLFLFAIAGLAAAWCVPAASDERMELPAQVICSPEGRVVAIQVVVPQAGVYTLELPADVCSKPAEAPAQQPRPAAPASRSLQI